MSEAGNDQKALVLSLTSGEASAMMAKTLRRLVIQEMLLALRGNPTQAEVEELLDNLIALIIAQLWERLQVGKA